MSCTSGRETREMKFYFKILFFIILKMFFSFHNKYFVLTRGHFLLQMFKNYFIKWRIFNGWLKGYHLWPFLDPKSTTQACSVCLLNVIKQWPRWAPNIFLSYLKPCSVPTNLEQSFSNFIPTYSQLCYSELTFD